MTDDRPLQRDFYIVQNELVSRPRAPFVSASFSVHPLRSWRQFPAVSAWCVGGTRRTWCLHRATRSKLQWSIVGLCAHRKYV